MTNHRSPEPGLLKLNRASRSVIDACVSAGGRPLIVGGSVRDALLGDQHPKDVDIEVYGVDADALVAALSTVGRVDEVGKSFGVLKVSVMGTDFDVSLPRADSKTGDGHRGFSVRVDHDLSEVEAFGRRDFTINAMGWDPTTGELIDPFDGRQDLTDGVLRHTTDAFAEDPLRVLRGVQFASRFNLIIASATCELCEGLVDTFKDLAIERVWGEFEKIGTMGRVPSDALLALQDVGWDVHFPELADLHVYDGDIGFDGMTGEDRVFAVFAAIVKSLGRADAQSFLERIGAPVKLREKVGAFMQCLSNQHVFSPSPAQVRFLTRHLAGPKGPGLRLWARVLDAPQWVAAADELGLTDVPEAPLLTGDDLIELGMTPGPLFRPILQGALDAQDWGHFSTKAGALAWLDKL